MKSRWQLQKLNRPTKTIYSILIPPHGNNPVRLLSELVMISSPKMTIIQPPAIAIIRSVFWYCFNKRETDPIKTAAVKKGSPSPKEYAVKRMAPVVMLKLLPARRSIDANIGPVQGVQPVENAIPIKSELAGPALPGVKQIRFSLSNISRRKNPAMCMPKKIIKTPLNQRNNDW